jgi:hypothetical protein
MKQHAIFRIAWWSVNLLLAASLVALLFAGGWEYSVRRYLKGFSDAIVPVMVSPEQKIEAILDWMRNGPSRASTTNPDALARRDPENTLNYQQLLQVCGTATNAFLNVAKSAGLEARRLLLLDPQRRAKHVVTEVLIDNRWIIVDPAYRVILRDAHGRSLTRQELRSPEVFSEVIRTIAGYPPEYDYGSVAHVRLARIPFIGTGLRKALDWIYPGWEEAANWSLIVERRSFGALFVSIVAAGFLLLLRTAFAWYADRKLHLPRVRLRVQLQRAGTAFFSGPELK